MTSSDFDRKPDSGKRSKVEKPLRRNTLVLPENDDSSNDDTADSNNLDKVATEASEIDENIGNSGSSQHHVFHTDIDNYVQEDYSRFINPWRKHAMETSFLTEDDHIEKLPVKNIFTANGLKRENIFEQKKLSEKPNKGKTLQIRVKSVGCFDPPLRGNDCEDTAGLIAVDGTDVSQNKPGFNLVLIDLRSGEIEQSVNFDTHGKAGEYEKLEEFLNSLEMWKIICIAVKDDAKNYLPMSALKNFGKVGASEIVRDEIEYRSSYAFIGLTGPEKARPRLEWIREENSKAGQGPSIISVSIKTGDEAYKAAGGKLSKVSRSHLQNSEEKNSNNAQNEVQQHDADANDEVIKQGISKNEDPSPVYELKSTYHEAKNIHDQNRKDVSKLRDNNNDEDEIVQNKTTKSNINATKGAVEAGSVSEKIRNSSNSIPTSINSEKSQNEASTENSTVATEKALLENKLKIEQMVSKIMNSQKVENASQQDGTKHIPLSTISLPQTDIVPEQNRLSSIDSSLQSSSVNSIAPDIAAADMKQEPIEPTLQKEFPTTEKFLPSLPETNVFDVARKIGLSSNIPGDQVIPLKQEESNGQLGNIELIQSFIKNLKKSNGSFPTSAEINTNQKKFAPSPKDLLTETIANIKSNFETSDLIHKTISQPGNILENAYASTGTPVPSSSGAQESASVSEGDTRTMPVDVPANADPRISTMETAGELAGSRNVGESRLASALSSLGIPDAGATGIASLMASGFVAAGANNKKDAALKLGLAAKLSKSIADLGGRGAASAAGIASLNELLKDGREMTTSRLADQIGQALQRVGGAGAAVGYSALAAALKAIGGTRSPGALVGGVILALAEQGSAPGTAGLAALAAGLGGSGADALASGLGGSLPNVAVVGKSNNILTNSLPGETREPAVTSEVGVLPRPATGTTPVLADTFVQQPPSISSGLQYHPGNIETEYTGQGPIGSVSQGNFANAAKLLPNKFLNPEPVAALSTNGDHVDVANHPVTAEVASHPSPGVIPAVAPVQVADHAHEVAQPVTNVHPVLSNEPVVSSDLLNTLIAKLTESLKAKSPIVDSVTHVTNVADSVEGSPAHQATAVTQTALTAPAQIERKVDLNEVLSSALGHKQGVSIPEVMAELQHPVSSNTEAAVALVNQLGTHLTSDLHQTGCCNGVSGEMGNVNKFQPPPPPPLVHTVPPIGCGISIDKTIKRCLTKCTERKELYGRLVDLQSSGTKAVIKINGEDWSKDDNGINIVVLDFVTGEVEATENFDTEVDGGASKAMSNFIKSLRPGKVILGATKGRAGMLINGEAYEALKDAGAKKIYSNHLDNAAKYVFVGYKGDEIVSWQKEDLVGEKSDSSASLIEPIVVGPGALKNSCVCLQSCNEAENKKIATLKSSKQPTEETNSEKAYADMGDMPIAPGSAGTKRMVSKNGDHSTDDGLSNKDLSIEDFKNMFVDSSEGSGDEKLDNLLTASLLLHPQTTDGKARKKIKVSHNEVIKAAKGSRKLKIASKHPRKSQDKLLALQKKGNKLKQKTHTKRAKQKLKTEKMNIIDILSEAGVLQYTKNIDDTRVDSKALKIKHLRPLGEGGLSLVNGISNHVAQKLRKRHEKHKSEEKAHLAPAFRPIDEKPKQNTTAVEKVDYDDVYSTIGNNLHSRKKSERPRPDIDIR